MSFINRENKRGPRTEPCGIPEVVSSRSEQPPLSSTTACDLPVRYENIHFNASSENPTLRNLIIRSLEWDAVSKTLLKSNRTKIVTHRLSNARQTRDRAVCVLCEERERQRERERERGREIKRGGWTCATRTIAVGCTRRRGGKRRHGRLLYDSNYAKSRWRKRWRSAKTAWEIAEQRPRLCQWGKKQ